MATPRSQGISYKAAAFVFFAVVFLMSMPAGVLILWWWSIRARKSACLEMKRHVRQMEISGGA
jgi:hypothetical protein